MYVFCVVSKLGVCTFCPPRCFKGFLFHFIFWRLYSRQICCKNDRRDIKKNTRWTIFWPFSILNVICRFQQRYSQLSSNQWDHCQEFITTGNTSYSCSRLTAHLCRLKARIIFWLFLFNFVCTCSCRWLCQRSLLIFTWSQDLSCFISLGENIFKQRNCFWCVIRK